MTIASAVAALVESGGEVRCLILWRGPDVLWRTLQQSTI